MVRHSLPSGLEYNGCLKVDLIIDIIDYVTTYGSQHSIPQLCNGINPAVQMSPPLAIQHQNYLM